MSFKIDKDVDLPPNTGLGGGRKYPFNEMKPGDSFLINGADPSKVSRAAISFGKAYDRGWKFSIQKTDEGYRCWRVK